VRAHDEFDADDVVVEVNFGGDMATEVIKAAADRAHRLGKRDSNLIRIKEVNASERADDDAHFVAAARWIDAQALGFATISATEPIAPTRPPRAVEKWTSRYPIRSS
jgi:hypothetical protein